MAKGKYKQRKVNRDASELAADLQRVRIQLAAEQDRLEQMQFRAELDAQLRAELAVAIEARDAVCRPQLDRMRADRDVIVVATRELTALNRDLARHWEKIADWGWERFGPELFYSIISGDRRYMNDGVVADRLSRSEVEAIQRARGLRRDAPEGFSADQKLALARSLADATGTVLPDDVTDVDGPAWDAYMDAVEKDVAAVIAFRSPPPWLDISAPAAGSVSEALGGPARVEGVAVDAASRVPAVSELSTGTAAQRDAAVAAGAEVVARAFVGTLQENVTLAHRSQIRSMIAGCSPYPAPADAAALQAWYALSAAGGWGRVRTPAYGQMAVAAAAAVPFWLPPGHTMAYLDSEPLSGEDVEDMRMPFPQVLVTFAEPPRLPALGPRTLSGDPRMRWIDHLVGSARGLPDTREMIIGGTNLFKQPTPTLWDAIRVAGCAC